MLQNNRMLYCTEYLRKIYVSLRLRDRFFTNEYRLWLNFSPPLEKQSPENRNTEIIYYIHILQIIIDNFIYLGKRLIFTLFNIKI